MVKCKQCGVELSIVKGNRGKVILLDKEGYQHKDVCQLNKAQTWKKFITWRLSKTEELERKDSRSEADE